MDELLNFMEEDITGGGSDEDPDVDPRIPDPSCRRMTLSPLKNNNNTSPSSLSQQNVTFKDIFGSPDKRDVKELGLSKRSSSSSSLNPTKKFDLGSSSSMLSSRAPALSSSSSSSFPSSSSSSIQSQIELSRAIKQDSKVPYKPDPINSMVIDPYSRVRVVKSSISIYFDETMSAEAALKDRNLGMEFVNLGTFSSWYRGKGKDQKNFWISGVLVRKTPGPRKSAKGNDYHIWELSDLKELDKKVTVFLFGSAGTSSGSTGVAATPLGSIVDFTTPSVMQDSSSGQVKFSVNNSTQVRFIGQARDFGYCEARKKDGNKCTAVVNTWECSFCIHHAASELKRLNFGSSKTGGKLKGKSVPNNKPFGSFGGSGGGFGGESQESLKQQGVFIADFGGGRPSLIGGGGGVGGGGLNRSYGGGGSSKKTIITSRPNLPPSSRMALQGGVNTMGKNPLKFGNPDNMKFISKGGEDHPLLKKEGVVAPVVRKPLDLNPTRTRHLTDKDRELLSKLECIQQTPVAVIEEEPDTQSQSKNKKQKTIHGPGGPQVVSELITTSIVNNPTAASRNFLQYLSLQHAPKDQVDLSSSRKSSTIQPLTMSRAKVQSMEKALNFVKKNGPLQKTNPNSAKRKSAGSSQSPAASLKSLSSSKKRPHSQTQIDVEFDFDSDDFKKILNAKSAHDEELEEIQHDEYFEKLEKKEALENKLLNTFSLETNAVMCRQCKYVALSQSEFCKEKMHQIRLVKARKRFFKCKDCGNRTMSLDRLPKRPCNNCNSSSWLAAPVGKERKGPTLPSEMLSVRGHEEKNIGSAGSTMFMHLEV